MSFTWSESFRKIQLQVIDCGRFVRKALSRKNFFFSKAVVEPFEVSRKRTNWSIEERISQQITKQRSSQMFPEQTSNIPTTLSGYASCTTSRNGTKAAIPVSNIRQNRDLFRIAMSRIKSFHVPIRIRSAMTSSKAGKHLLLRRNNRRHFRQGKRRFFRGSQVEFFDIFNLYTWAQVVDLRYWPLGESDGLRWRERLVWIRPETQQMVFRPHKENIFVRGQRCYWNGAWASDLRDAAGGCNVEYYFRRENAIRRGETNKIRTFSRISRNAVIC